MSVRASDDDRDRNRDREDVPKRAVVFETICECGKRWPGAHRLLIGAVVACESCFEDGAAYERKMTRRRQLGRLPGEPLDAKLAASGSESD